MSSSIRLYLGHGTDVLPFATLAISASARLHRSGRHAYGGRGLFFSVAGSRVDFSLLLKNFSAPLHRVIVGGHGMSTCRMSVYIHTTKLGTQEFDINPCGAMLNNSDHVEMTTQGSYGG